MNNLTLVESSKRRLDDTYIVVYAIKNEINIKKGDYIEKRSLSRLVCEFFKNFVKKWEPQKRK